MKSSLKEGIYYVTAVFVVTIAMIQSFAYLQQRTTKEIKNAGFINATPLDSSKYLCRAGDKRKLCDQKLVKNISNKKNLIFIMGNSQMGAINNFEKGDMTYASLLAKDRFFAENNLLIRSLWIDNATLKEFNVIYNAIKRCKVDPKILIIPAFLDDTRETVVRKSLDNYSNYLCGLPSAIKNDKNQKNQEILNLNNSQIIEKYIRENFYILDFIQELNTFFRGKMYNFRNFIFRINSSTSRNIKRPSLEENLLSLEEIIFNRSNNKDKTVVYIPPLPYLKSKIKVPYQISQYSYFKKRIENICNKNNFCYFYNFENVVSDELWTNENDIKDFMHFKYEGHIEMFLMLKETIKNYI